ncbi:MAG: TA system VapC family ribonuclease toxin [Halioglobus sp.]|nr:TA system VapC family ribonuclease toxin [Halioglobus sp.]
MFVIDTNVLIYAADRDSPYHEVCRERLERWRRQPAPAFLTWSICYEFLRVTSHPRIFQRPWPVAEGWRFLDAVLAPAGVALLEPTDRHRAVLEQTLTELPDLQGNLVHDLHIAVLMREHGVSRIVTRDTDFHHFQFLTVLDPLREP